MGALDLLDLRDRSSRGNRRRGVRIAGKAEFLICQSRTKARIQLACACKDNIYGFFILQIEAVYSQLVVVNMAKNKILQEQQRECENYQKGRDFDGSDKIFFHTFII